jgi:hypothetical protein
MAPKASTRPPRSSSSTSKKPPKKKFIPKTHTTAGVTIGKNKKFKDPKKKKAALLQRLEKELPKLNMITPAGVIKPKGKKKGKIFVEDRERMMGILNRVNDDKDGRIKSKLDRSVRVLGKKTWVSTSADNDDTAAIGSYQGGKEEGGGGENGGKEIEDGLSSARDMQELRLTGLQQGAKDLVRRNRKRSVIGEGSGENTTKPRGKKVSFA